MNFLATCTDPGILSVILLFKRLFEIICILVPIGLILMASVEVGKITMNPDQKAVKSATTKTIHKCLAAVGVFFVPTFMSIFMNLMAMPNYKSSSCWSNSSVEMINAYEEAKDFDDDVEEEKRQQERKTAETERAALAAAREAAREENEKAAEEARKASGNSTGNPTELAAKMIQIAQREADSHPPDSPNKYTYDFGYIPGYSGNGYGYPWCAAFVWWISNEAGVYNHSNGPVTHKTAGVDSYIGYFRNNSDGNRYEPSAAHGGNYVPKMGDYIFFSNEHIQYDGDHIGVVKGVSGDKVLIIDGNCSNTVCDRYKSLNDGYIIGYGVWE